MFFQINNSLSRKLLVVSLVIFISGFIAGKVTAQSTASSPAIEIDPQNHAITFIVGGNEIAHINANGLYIQGDIEYSGTITDVPYSAVAAKDTKLGGEDE